MKKIVPMIILALILTACSLPSSATPETQLSPEEMAQTLVAQTQAAAAAMETETPPTPTATATPESTSTPSVATLNVSVATNCRTGPDVIYPLVMVFQPGATAEVVGKYQAPEYWIIKTPTDETCWLWGAYATVSGNTSILPDMAAPNPPLVEEVPTDDPGNGGGGVSLTPMILVLAPPAPNDFSATASCQFLTLNNNQKILQGKMDTLNWSTVNGAVGYKLYVNGVEKEDVWGAAVTFNFNGLVLQSTTYGIASYNNYGTSSVKTIPAPDCP